MKSTTTEASRDWSGLVRRGVIIVSLVSFAQGFLFAGAALCAEQDGAPPAVLLELAEKGDPKAQFEVGVLFYEGRGVPKNAETAFGWFHKAAEQGYAAAQYAVGRMSYYGRGVKQDAGEAMKWFRKAADSGYADAQFALGVMYQFGKTVDKDLQEAAKWYRVAAEKGLAAAQYALGAMYNLGEGVVKDAQEGIRWLRKAAEKNYEPATRTIVIIESSEPDATEKIRQIQMSLSDSL